MSTASLRTDFHLLIGAELVAGEESLEVINRLEVGTAWVNQHRATSATVPFGGAKESGMGRQYSILGLKENMEPQVISVLKQPM